MWKEVLRPQDAPHLEGDYELGEVLGKGAFGIVRFAKDRRSGALCACKSVSKARLVTHEDVQDMRREVEILHLLTPHHTLATLVDVYEDRNSVHLVLQYCAGGELFDAIISRGTFSEAMAARFFRQMVEMVHHCHTCGVMHRDIKPENFLLSDSSDDANLLACDFGLGTFYQPGQVLTTMVGSPYYVAPEVLRRSYGPEADIWSLGVVLYILLCGMPPFYGSTDKEIFTSILRGSPNMTSDPWPKISEEAKDLINQMLQLDPTKRCTTTEMLSHPWLREHGVASDAPLDNVVIQRMKQFASMAKVMKAAVLTASRHLKHEEVQGLRELFKTYDADGDGHITLDELRAALSSSGAGLTDSEIKMVMQDTDVDGSGAIDYAEFLAATVNLALLEREELLIKVFEELDEDGSGTLTIDEVQKALSKSGLGVVEYEEVVQFCKEADVNGDGVIDFAEFVQAWKAKGAGGAAQAASALRRGVSLASAYDMDIDEGVY